MSEDEGGSNVETAVDVRKVEAYLPRITASTEPSAVQPRARNGFWNAVASSSKHSVAPDGPTAVTLMVITPDEDAP